jgi:trk system potassium uptake protein TrkH
MFGSTVLKVIGGLIVLFSLSYVPPILLSQLFHDQLAVPFLICFAVTVISGLLLWTANIRAVNDVSHVKSFLIVGSIWFVLGLFGSLPFMLITHLSFTEAVFETVSGLTTTGATVISGLDTLPKSLLYYRQQLQWLGGMGIIVLVVALMPMLNIGGMRLLKAEIPGPMKDDKLTPRILNTARYLWIIYLLLTLLCAGAYWLFGMSFFDAVAHAMTTVSSGGFSTHDASMGFFNKPAIEIASVIFMLAGAVNFGLHFLALRSRSVSCYWRDQEFKAYIYIILFIVIIVTAGLLWSGHYDNVLTALRYSLFEVVSVITSTGYGTADFSKWPGYLGLLLILSSFIGGCAGSTAGGMKVVRVLYIVRGAWREIRRLLHPRAEFHIKHNGRPVSHEMADSIRGFMFLYCIVTAVLVMAMVATGLDYASAFSAVAACLNVLGPGLGEVATSFATVTPIGKWLMVFAMIIGRLEIFTLLVLFHPMYWREI